MKMLSRPNPKQSALTTLVIVSQIFVVNHPVNAQSIPQISIPNISSPAIPVVIPNVLVPGVNVTTTNNIPATSLKSPPVVPTAITPTINITTTNNIPATSLKSPPVIPTAITPTFNVITTNNIPATSLIAQPVIPTVNVTTTNNIPATSLIAQPVIPTVNVSFNELGLPIFANYDGIDISTNIPSISDLKPLTFSVTGNQGNTEPSFLSVINNNGVTNETTEVGSTSILIPKPTPVDGQLVTVSTVNVVFPSSQLATGITSTATGNSSSFNLQVNFTPPVLD